MPFSARPRLQPVGYDEHLSLVAHLEELRTRLFVSLAVVAVAFGFCFWQNHRLLQLINRPLAHQTQQQVREGHGPLGATYAVQRGSRDVAVQLGVVVGALRRVHAAPAEQTTLAQVARKLKADVARLSAPPRGDRPITLGIGEPFTTTVTVSLIVALILSSPLLLLQAYGFLAPAVEPEQRRRLRPLILAVPGLFVGGVAFGYFAVLPAAVRFFQNFNSAQFNVLVQASQYYKFAATLLLAMGLLFQVPLAILAATRSGLISVRRLRRSRGYAMVLCALVAALLPGDPTTMLLETVPLYLLFEASLLVASIAERRAHRAQGSAAFAAQPGA
jgi:sec-independent protein translocase protein TatC